MLLYELLDERMREHREHELAFDLGEGLKKMLEIFIVERAVIVSAVSSDIRWVNEMKGIFTAVAPFIYRMIHAEFHARGFRR